MDHGNVTNAVLLLEIWHRWNLMEKVAEKHIIVVAVESSFRYRIKIIGTVYGLFVFTSIIDKIIKNCVELGLFTKEMII